MQLKFPVLGNILLYITLSQLHPPEKNVYGGSQNLDTVFPFCFSKGQHKLQMSFISCGEPAVMEIE